jgi:hypothetical protein
VLKSLYQKKFWKIFWSFLTRRKITTVCLLLFASVCVWNEITRHPEVHVRAKSLPSMQEALLQAMDLAIPLRLFTDLEPHGISRDVNISVTKQDDGSIQVLFSEGPKLVGASTKSLFEVLFSVSEKPSIEWVTGKLENQEADPENVMYSRAIKTVVSSYKLDRVDEFQEVISVREDEDEFIVFTKSIPSGPGNHGSYALSKDFKILYRDGGA